MLCKTYEKRKYPLELAYCKLQAWVKKTRQRVVNLFKVRDAASKGGAIKRFMQRLNPRDARVVALEKISETERGPWHYQCYENKLPTAGEIMLFDRSCYKRTARNA